MNPQSVKLDVFGKRFVVERVDEKWCAYEVGPEGKRSRVYVAVPDSLDEGEIAQYFDDLYHEAATPQRPTVIRLP